MPIIARPAISAIKSNDILVKTNSVKTVKNSVRGLGRIIVINMGSNGILFMIRNHIWSYFQERLLGKYQIKEYDTEYVNIMMVGSAQKIITLFIKYKYLDQLNNGIYSFLISILIIALKPL